MANANIVCNICEGPHHSADCDHFESFTMCNEGSSVDFADVTRTIRQDAMNVDSSCSDSSISSIEQEWTRSVSSTATTAATDRSAGRARRQVSCTGTERTHNARARAADWARNVHQQPTSAFAEVRADSRARAAEWSRNVRRRPTSVATQTTTSFVPPPSYEETFPNGPPWEDIVQRALEQVLRTADWSHILPNCVHCERCCSNRDHS